MVGCAAGTIKNVWCRTSDRHMRFGHNSGGRLQLVFKRLCNLKAVAAVKGASFSHRLSPLPAVFGPNWSNRVSGAGCFGLCDKDGTVRPCRRGHGLLWMSWRLCFDQ